MIKIVLPLLVLFTAQALFSQTSHISGGNVTATQNALKEQNVLNENTKALDRKFELQKLQREAVDATANVTAQQRQQQFNLGAEILPFVVPYITKITQDCVKSVDLKDSNADAKYAECSKTAVQKFQNNPEAFLRSLPETDRIRLEALVRQRIEESTRRPARMEP